MGEALLTRSSGGISGVGLSKKLVHTCSFSGDCTVTDGKRTIITMPDYMPYYPPGTIFDDGFYIVDVSIAPFYANNNTSSDSTLKLYANTFDGYTTNFGLYSWAIPDANVDTLCEGANLSTIMIASRILTIRNIVFKEIFFSGSSYDTICISDASITLDFYKIS